MFEKMLIALDDSEHTERTLLTAAGLAKLSSGEVEVLHVARATSSAAPVRFLTRGAPSRKRRLDAVKVLNDQGVKATGTLRGALHGRVAREILDEAATSGASVIVMGSHGAGELEGMLLGSTTHKVLHLGKLPVFVVR